MALSLTCVCGARLEIDEKFRGQVISCPDCNKPLSTVLPPRGSVRTSGFALASLLLALIGAFTLIGPLLAAVCGVVGLRHIRRTPERLAGAKLAKAGIGLGLAFSALSVAAFFWADWLGLDSLVRGLEWANQIEYKEDLEHRFEHFQERGFSLRRPSARWGRFQETNTISGQKPDKLILLHLREDAYILVLEEKAETRDDLEECRFKALDRLKESPFLRRLGRLKPNEKFPDVELTSYKQLPNTEILEMQLEVVLARIPRTMAVRVERTGIQLFVVVCVTRAHRFARLEEVFRQALDSFKIEQ